MTKFVLKRIVALVPVVIGISFIIFAIMDLTPGEPARLILGPYASQSDVETFNQAMGLWNIIQNAKRCVSRINSKDSMFLDIGYRRSSNYGIDRNTCWNCFCNKAILHTGLLQYVYGASFYIYTWILAGNYVDASFFPPAWIAAGYRSRKLAKLYFALHHTGSSLCRKFDSYYKVEHA